MCDTFYAFASSKSSHFLFVSPQTLPRHCFRLSVTVIVSVKKKIRNNFDANCGQTNELWKDVGMV